jgi:hypothetical protein
MLVAMVSRPSPQRSKTYPPTEGAGLFRFRDFFHLPVDMPAAEEQHCSYGCS